MKFIEFDTITYIKTYFEYAIDEKGWTKAYARFDDDEYLYQVDLPTFNLRKTDYIEITIK